jgi:DNA polymerase III delta subunit
MEKSQTYYYRQIVDSLSKGRIEPAYFIFGDESYLIDSLIEQICAKFLGKAEKEMNYYLRYAPDSTLDEVMALTAGCSPLRK